MATLIYKVPGRTTTVTYKGFLEFEPCSLLKPVKGEYGVDDATLDFIGAAPKLAAFLRTLSQGKRYDQDGRQWFLQRWAPDDNKIWPTVTLYLKGLAEGRLPQPKGSDTTVTQSVTVNATVTEDDEEVSVVREINYKTLQTTWQYVSNGRPKTARVGKVSLNGTPIITSSTIEAGGRTYRGSTAPANYVTATTPALQDVVQIESEPIWGTSYFDVSEHVTRMFVAA